MVDALAAACEVGIGEALAMLAHRCGLDRDGPHPPALSGRTPSAPAMPAVDRLVVRYVEACERILWSRTGRPVLDWLLARGLDPEVLRANRVGADPGPSLLWRPAAGFPARGVGAVFPALDRDGAVVYCQTRYVVAPSGRSKYDNPSARWAPNPRVGWVSPPSAAPTAREPLVVCEGFPDAYTAASAGFASVAVLGAGYPDARVGDAIAAGAAGRDVVVVYDADPAGRQGAATLVAFFAGCGIEARDVVPPAAVNDVNGWALHDRRWVEHLGAALPVGSTAVATARSMVDVISPSAVCVPEVPSC